MTVVINGTTGITSPADSISGNLTFTGTGNRITGDFSNATVANRAAFQTSTANSSTAVSLIPSGTGNASLISFSNASDPDNAAFNYVGTVSSEFRVAALKNGTGSYQPVVVQTGGSERMRIDTSGNVGIGTSSPSAKLDVNKGSAGVLANFTDGVSANCQISTASLVTTIGPTAGSTSLALQTGATERARIDSSGNLLVGTTSAFEKFVLNGSQRMFGYVYPGTDNNWSCGLSSFRWSVIYAATGTINTSDAREKTTVSPLNQSEINAAKQLADEIGSYKWLASIEEKGDAARAHIGMTVQRAIEIMEANGLTPFNYGFICYDEWEDKFVKDEDGNDVLDVAEGSRFSFRMDELSLFIARGQQAAIQEQQAMIALQSELITQLQAQLTAVSTDVAALKGN